MFALLALNIAKIKMPTIQHASKKPYYQASDDHKSVVSHYFSMAIDYRPLLLLITHSSYAIIRAGGVVGSSSIGMPYVATIVYHDAACCSCCWWLLWYYYRVAVKAEEARLL
jgi:hypothetical protein